VFEWKQQSPPNNHRPIKIIPISNKSALLRPNQKRDIAGKRTLYSDLAIGAITLVVSFDAPLELRKSSTSKLVSAPAFALTLQQPHQILTTKIEKESNKNTMEDG